jgi:hypothetical protein
MYICMYVCIYVCMYVLGNTIMLYILNPLLLCLYSKIPIKPTYSTFYYTKIPTPYLNPTLILSFILSFRHCALLCGRNACDIHTYTHTLIHTYITTYIHTYTHTLDTVPSFSGEMDVVVESEAVLGNPPVTFTFTFEKGLSHMYRRLYSVYAV